MAEHESCNSAFKVPQTITQECRKSLSPKLMKKIKIF